MVPRYNYVVLNGFYIFIKVDLLRKALSSASKGPSEEVYISIKYTCDEKLNWW